MEARKANALKAQLEETFTDLYGKDSPKVVDFKNYMVEDTDMPTICRLFRIQVRVTLDYPLRSWHEKNTWDRIWGEDGVS